VPHAQFTLSQVVQRLLESCQIAAIAPHQAGYIDDGIEHEWMALTTSRLAARYGLSDKYHALRADADQRSAATAARPRDQGLRGGVPSAPAIGTLRGVTLEAAAAELSEAGVTPAHRPVAWVGPARPAADVV
jgi:hypothetical protein